MITGASFVGNLFRDAQLLPSKKPGSPSMGVFSVAVAGPAKDAPPTAVDCFFYVSEGKKPPFVLDSLKKGTKVVVTGGEMFTADNNGKMYLKCKVTSPYTGINVIQKTAPASATQASAPSDDDGTPF